MLTRTWSPVLRSTWTPWNNLLGESFKRFCKAPSRNYFNNKPGPYSTNCPVPTVAEPVRSILKPGPCSSSALASTNTNRAAIARPVAGIFFPLRPNLRSDNHCYSPDLSRRIVQLAAELKSFQQATNALRVAADTVISGRHIHRFVGEVGSDLAHQRYQHTQQYRRRQLPMKVDQPPDLAVVEIDGGRLFSREADSKPGGSRQTEQRRKNPLFVDSAHPGC